MLEVENWWNGRSHRAAEVGLSGKSRSADVDPNRAENLMRSGFLGLPAFSLSSMFNINELSVFWNFRFWSQNLEVKGLLWIFPQSLLWFLWRPSWSQSLWSLRTHCSHTVCWDAVLEGERHSGKGTRGFGDRPDCVQILAATSGRVT